jgi:serine phosphatase RsbU (regulator of sigma subunit)
LYLFSDGYADQFGGTNSKKMMTKRFKDVLLEINKMNMPEQKEYLANFFEEWKGGNEQVDDILVIGVRL